MYTKLLLKMVKESSLCYDHYLVRIKARVTKVVSFFPLIIDNKLSTNFQNTNMPQYSIGMAPQCLEWLERIENCSKERIQCDLIWNMVRCQDWKFLVPWWMAEFCILYSLLVTLDQVRMRKPSKNPGETFSIYSRSGYVSLSTVSLLLVMQYRFWSSYSHD